LLLYDGGISSSIALIGITAGAAELKKWILMDCLWNLWTGNQLLGRPHSIDGHVQQ